MIHLVKNQTQSIVVTLTEKATLSSPNWLFVFKSQMTKEVVSFVLLGSADLSNNKERYNKFSIITNAHFAEKTVGEYTYTVYEQLSTNNKDIKNTIGVVEVGQMKLGDSSEYRFTTFNSTNNKFIVRDT